MRIQYISDLHLERLSVKSSAALQHLINPKASICVLAGDIGDPFGENYHGFLTEMRQKFKKVFLIAGNHEYSRDKTMVHTNQKISSIAKHLDISFLNNRAEMYGGICFAGTTLWTQHYNQKEIQKVHKESNQFLWEIQHTHQCNPKIIMSHHLPIQALVLDKYKTSNHTHFHTDLDEYILMHNNSILGWIYGHTHTGSIQRHYDTDFYCNPVGHRSKEINMGVLNKTAIFQKN